jgi:protein-disulfide isomerase
MLIFKQKKDNYKSLLIGIIVIITIGLAVVAVSNLIKENGGKNIIVQKEKTNSEESELLDKNKEALEKAKNGEEGVLRKIDETDHIVGKLEAPVELIIYSDFECPFCADFAKTVKRAINEFGDKIVVAYRHFPLTAIHDNALAAAIASECAAEQGKFWEMHDKLFYDNETGRMSATQFKADAQELKLNQVKFNKCLDTEKYKDKVMSEILEGRNAGVTGTPGSFLNGQPLPGAYQYEDFTDSGGYARKGMKSLIERALSNLNK